jgi:hypothetical protein
MLHKMVVEPAALFELLIQKSFLFMSRIQPILECAPHVVCYYIISTILQALH